MITFSHILAVRSLLDSFILLMSWTQNLIYSIEVFWVGELDYIDLTPSPSQLFSNMKVRILLSDKKTASIFDLADFNRKAEVIFNKEVLPQIAYARKNQKPSDAVKCNNPI